MTDSSSFPRNTYLDDLAHCASKPFQHETTASILMHYAENDFMFAKPKVIYQENDTYLQENLLYRHNIYYDLMAERVFVVNKNKKEFETLAFFDLYNQKFLIYPCEKNIIPLAFTPTVFNRLHTDYNLDF